MVQFCFEIIRSTALNIKLQNIATITTGFYGQAEPDANLVCLQARNFDDNGRLVEELFPELKASFKTKKHLLKHGDVLFAAKGSRCFATYYNSQDYPPAVASTTFFIIRLFEETIPNVLPEYLVWILNHKSTKQKITQTSSGTAINSISKSFLTELEIELPTLAIQKQIVTINELYLRECMIKNKLYTLRESAIQLQLNKALNL